MTLIKNHISNKNSGDPVSYEEWNALASDVNQLAEMVETGEGVGSGGTTVVDTNGLISKNVKGNLTLGSNSIKNINIEPGYPYSQDNTKYGDIALKPGDDIQFASHHREPKKRDKIVVKNIDGSDNPVKLQIVAGEIDFAVGTENNPKTATKKKDKTTGADTAEAMFKVDDAKTMDIRILTGVTLDPNTNNERDERGYLKVRAQAIDLRCEKHGGIALQPKGYDGDGNMNKIKFEHGGGDGLEFGTFNAEKTSIFTDEYRFKKNGIWKMATRETIANTKTIYDDNTPSGKTSTAALKYVKQNDDFYDIIDVNDEQCTTNDLIKTAHAFNNSKNRHAKYEEKTTTSGNLKKTLEIETVVTITYSATESAATSQIVIPEAVADVTSTYTISDFKDAIKTVLVDNVAQKYGTAGDDGVTLSAGDIVTINGANYTIVENFAPSMEITSGADLSVKAKGGKLSLGGDLLEFGSDSIDLGEMEDGLYAQYKLTKKNNSKPCDTLKIKVINNTANEVAFDSDASNFAIDSFYPGSDANHPAAVNVPGKVAEPTTDAEATQHIQIVAQCKLIDIIKFVTWAKNNNFGPWGTA